MTRVSSGAADHTKTPRSVENTPRNDPAVSRIPGVFAPEDADSRVFTQNTQEETRRQPGRPFQKGNPGRPKGARNKATRAAEALLDGEAEALTRKAIELALGGNLAALRLCIERLVPRSERTVSVDLPEVRTTADTVDLAGVLPALVGAGELKASEARALASMLGAHLGSLRVKKYTKDC